MRLVALVIALVLACASPVAAIDLRPGGVTMAVAGTCITLTPSTGLGAVTIATCQNLSTTGTPTFAGLTLNGTITTPLEAKGSSDAYVKVTSTATTKDAAFQSSDGTNNVYSGLLKNSGGATGAWSVYVGGIAFEFTSTLGLNLKLNPIFNAAALTTATPANTTALAVAGYSLTGSSALSMASFAGTVSTSGVVDVVKLAITDTAHGAGSNLLAIYGGASGTTAEWKLDTSGNETVTGSITCCVSTPTAVTNMRVYTPSLTPANTAAAIGASTQTFTVTGLTTADKVFVNGPASTALCPLTGHAKVTAADTLELEWVDLTVALCTPAAGTYTVFAIRS